MVALDNNNNKGKAMQKQNVFYKRGMRLAYMWLDKSYTTGTVTNIQREGVTVEWDDKTTTTSPFNWVMQFTLPLNKNGRPFMPQ